MGKVVLFCIIPVEVEQSTKFTETEPNAPSVALLALKGGSFSQSASWCESLAQASWAFRPVPASEGTGQETRPTEPVHAGLTNHW